MQETQNHNASSADQEYEVTQGGEVYETPLLPRPLQVIDYLLWMIAEVGILLLRQHPRRVRHSF
jgi:hypothetical protein